MPRRKGIKTRPAKRISESHSRMDRFDLVRDHIKNGTELDETTDLFYKRSVHTFRHLCEGLTDKEVSKLIQEEYEVGARQANNIIRDSKKLFGAEPVGAHMAAEKKILIEMAKEAYNIAKAEKRGRDMVSAVKVLADLIGVNNQDSSLQEMYESLQLPDIIYTNDEAAFYEPEEAGTFEVVEEKAISA